MDDAKTASKRVVQKTAEDTGELIVNKIADKIRARSKDKEKEDEANKIETLFIEKTQQVLKISLRITSKWNTKNVQTSQVTYQIKYLDLLVREGQMFMINLTMRIAQLKK